MNYSRDYYTNNDNKNLKKNNCSLLPPCSKVLKQKIRRALMVSMIWNRADSPTPAGTLNPLDYGCTCVDDIRFLCSMKAKLYLIL